MDSVQAFNTEKAKADKVISQVFQTFTLDESEKTKEELEKEAHAALTKILGDCKKKEDVKAVLDNMSKFIEANDSAVQKKAKEDKKNGSMLLKTWNALKKVLKFLLSSTLEFVWNQIKGVVKTVTAMIVIVGMLWCWNPTLVKNIYDFLVKTAQTVEQAKENGEAGAQTAAKKALPIAKKAQSVADKVTGRKSVSKEETSKEKANQIEKDGNKGSSASASKTLSFAKKIQSKFKK